MSQDATKRARELRRSAPWAEDVLWQRLRNRKTTGYKFRRQQPFDQYVLDFFCAQKRLAVELDGRQHGEPTRADRDRRRSEYFEAHGVKVVRFWNFQIRENVEGVLERIRQELVAR